jgi:hypothetical protein
LDSSVFFEISSIVDDAVIDDLSDESDWALSTVFVDVRHVDIINKVNHNFSRPKSIQSVVKLCNTGLENILLE